MALSIDRGSIDKVLSKLLPPILVLVGLLACLGFYLREADYTEQAVREAESARVDGFAYLAELEIRTVADDLRDLAGSGILQEYLSSGDASDLGRVVEHAVFYSLRKLAYDQVRYLDEAGREVFRVNQGGITVPADQLQDKSDRPYFLKSLGLNEGQIYLSSFDLNVEEGKIEQPIKPVWRLVMPVFDGAGNRRGAYVVNFLGSSIFKLLEDARPNLRHRLRVLNAQGYWLKAERPEHEWGFMFPKREGMTLADRQPEIWARLAGESSGQAYYSGGLLTWRQIVIRREEVEGVGAILAEDEFLVVASEISGEEFGALFTNLRVAYGAIGGLLLFFSYYGLGFFRARENANRLLRREANLALTLQSIGDAVLTTDTQERVTRLNREAERLTGWSESDARGKPLDQVFRLIREETRTPEVGPGEDQWLEETGQIGGLANQALLITRLGQERPIASSAAPIGGEQGASLGTVIVFRDVSAERESQKKIASLVNELQRNAVELQQSNQELDDFAYIASHDLKEPLRGINNYAGFLLEDYFDKLDEEGRSKLEVVQRLCRRLDQLLDSLLFYSRIGRTEENLRSTDLDEIIDEVLESLQVSLEESGVEVRRPRPMPSVHCDPTWVAEIFRNLITNALKYNDKEERWIEIGWSKKDVVQSDSTGNTSPANRADESADAVEVFYVRDNGIGIKPQHVNSIFKIFKRLHSRDKFGGGSGAGLTIVKKFVERHGGWIRVESTFGEGTTFYFTLSTGPQGSDHREEI